MSVLHQTYPPYEVLVCDDGSTDDTEQVVRSIEDPRIRWINGPHSGRPAVPRNRGIDVCGGDWVAFLDSDDVWLPERLETQVSALSGTQLGAICSNAYREVGGVRVGILIHETRGILGFGDLVRDNKVVCSSMLVARQVLHRTGGFPESTALRVGEDFCLWMKVSKITPIGFVDEPLVIYRDEPLSSVRLGSPSLIQLRLHVLEEYMRWRIRQGAIRSFADLGAICLIRVLQVSKGCYFRLRSNLGRMRHSLLGSIERSIIPEPLSTVDADLQNPALQSPAVSVLLPMHNASAFVRSAVNSILEQSYVDFELIVVDDASTDGSCAVIDSIADRRIVRINFTENRGIVCALNAALEKAKGRYIARMDADDIALPDRLRQQVEFLDVHRDAALVGGWIEGFGNVRRRYVHRYPTSFDEIRATLLFSNPFAHPTVMMRRDRLDELKYLYSPETPYVEDWELWSRLVRVGTAANLPNVLLRYRIHAASSSRRFTALQRRSQRQLMRKIYSDSELPFRAVFVIGSPRSNRHWLLACHRYFTELLDAAAKHSQLNSLIFRRVLQDQLTLRLRSLVWFGLYPSWFFLTHALDDRPTMERIGGALRILILTNGRALVRFLRRVWPTE